MRGTIHHIDLTVSDLMVSAAFYETVLGFLGYRRTSTRPDYVDWNLPGGDGLLCSIGLKAARSDREHDRYSVGLHHLAWHAVDRADVDSLHELWWGRKRPSSIRQPNIQHTVPGTMPCSLPIRMGSSLNLSITPANREGLGAVRF